MEESVSQLLGNKGNEVWRRMQRSIVSGSLDIARTFKVVGTQYKPHFNHEGHVYTFLILWMGVKEIYRLGHLAF